LAQLSDDCFAFGDVLLSVDDAERMIAARVAPLSETETVALDAARGRGLAVDLIASVPLPTFDNSAVDGFAVRHDDLRADAPTRLVIGETVYAGSSPKSAVGDDPA
jgi:molybdopterin molybdotransferase